LRILSRYLVFELLKVFFVTLASMTAFMFLVLIGKEAVDEGLGLVPILRMMPYMLPQAMQFAVPGAMLLATTGVYGRVASSNEIVAIKSLGISPMVMLWPTLILATFVSFSAVALNDIAVSWGRGGVQQVILESLEEIVYGRLRTTRSFGNEKLKVTVKRLEGKRLIQPTFLFFPSKDKAPWTITADEARISVNREENNILLSLTNADVDMGGKDSGYFPGERELPISLADFSGQRGSSRSASGLSLREIGPAKAKETARIAQLKQEMAAEASFAMMTGRSFELSQSVWSRRESRLRSAENSLARLKIEPHRRWSNGFSCLGFVMIGAPMAVWRRHGEFWGSFFACFLPILLVYYPLLVGCVDRAKNGVFPPEAVWLGNLVLAGLGVWLMRRVVRF